MKTSSKVDKLISLSPYSYDEKSSKTLFND